MRGVLGPQGILSSQYKVVTLDTWTFKSSGLFWGGGPKAWDCSVGWDWLEFGVFADLFDLALATEIALMERLSFTAGAPMSC